MNNYKYNNLTKSQKNVVDVFLSGYLSSKEIARKLEISPSSVDWHFLNIRKSLCVNTNSEVFRILTKERKTLLLHAINQIKIVI